MSLSHHKSNLSQYIMSSITPLSTDILLGRGGNNFRHTGNDRLRKMAEGSAVVYHQATKTEKAIMINDMTQNLLREGVRFLNRVRPLGQPEYWEEADKDATRGKVSQELREAFKKLRKIQAKKQVTRDRQSSISFTRHRSEPCIPNPNPESPRSRFQLRSYSSTKNKWNVISRAPVSGEPYTETKESLPLSWDRSEQPIPRDEAHSLSSDRSSSTDKNKWNVISRAPVSSEPCIELKESLQSSWDRLEQLIPIFHRDDEAYSLLFPDRSSSSDKKWNVISRAPVSGEPHKESRAPVSGEPYTETKESLQLLWDRSEQPIPNFHRDEAHSLSSDRSSSSDKNKWNVISRAPVSGEFYIESRSAVSGAPYRETKESLVQSAWDRSEQEPIPNIHTTRDEEAQSLLCSDRSSNETDLSILQEEIYSSHEAGRPLELNEAVRELLDEWNNE